ncbi:MAG TPA: hypothetical protein VMM84_06085 [Pyrinomonadaceae bacterium]|nr:hypothetical protein [Pyrinomonadaceae bacterium]
MRKRFMGQIAFLVAVVIVVGLGVVEAGAQRRTRRSEPRITNPPIKAPTGQEVGEPKIISTADESSEATERATGSVASKKSGKARSAPQSEEEQMRETIDNLSNQVTQLTEKLNEMQEQQRALLEMERLSRAEQRAENLRAQLRDVEAKEADLQSRLEQVEFALLPENIERAMASFGSTRPEDAREYRRKQLNSEQGRLTSQLGRMAASRVRLEAAIANADRGVDLLRERLEKLDPVTSEPAKAPVVEDPDDPEEPTPKRDPFPEEE